MDFVEDKDEEWVLGDGAGERWTKGRFDCGVRVCWGIFGLEVLSWIYGGMEEVKTLESHEEGLGGIGGGGDWDWDWDWRLKYEICWQLCGDNGWDKEDWELGVAHESGEENEQWGGSGGGEGEVESKLVLGDARNWSKTFSMYFE